MKLQLYYPVKPFYVGQKFGETAYLAYYNNNGVYFTGHNGLDCTAIHGEEVRASHDGICEVQVDEKQGHGVVIRTEQEYEYKTGTAYFKTIYWHLIDNIPVKSGDRLKAGDLVGYANSTGLSTGDHLHYGLKPMKQDVNGAYYNSEQNNGYQGAIDPMPYFNMKYARDLVTGEFIFSTNLEYGQTHPDVFQLQSKLKRLGYFPLQVACTNYYGTVTRDSVFTFQQDYITELSWMAKHIYKGRYFSQQTRAAINTV